MARFEKIAPPAALLSGLRAQTEAVAKAVEAEAAAELVRAQRRKQALIMLGGGVAAGFVLMTVLENVHVELLGPIGGLLIFVVCLFAIFLLITNARGRSYFDPPPDRRRFSIAHDVLEALLPDLADTDATMWVVDDPVARAEVTERKRRGGGGWLEVRDFEWMQLEAKAGDGAVWTISARFLRREKSKPKRGGTKTRVQQEERVRVGLAAPAKQPLPSGMAAGLGRLAEGRRAVSSTLQVARARVRGPRRAEIELVLDEEARSARVAATGASFARFFAKDSAQLTADEIILGAALLARLRGRAETVNEG